eukprot:3260851-Rhodomonas_salina.3
MELTADGLAGDGCVSGGAFDHPPHGLQQAESHHPRLRCLGGDAQGRPLPFTFHLLALHFHELCYPSGVRLAVSLAAFSAMNLFLTL